MAKISYNDLDIVSLNGSYPDFTMKGIRFASNGIGVRLTTFHGLKGLEFDKVYLVDMQESIFPNYKKIEKECAMNEQAELEEKEECVRLFYVACTRPRDELVVMYNSNEPSTFIGQ